MTGSSPHSLENKKIKGPYFEKEAFDLTSIKARLSNLDDGEHDGCKDGCSHEMDPLANLPLSVQKCVYALEYLQDKRAQLESQFRAEVIELEKKYLRLYEPLYTERSKIVLGMREPTDEELAKMETHGVAEVDEEGKEKNSDCVVGIPKFWIAVLRNNPEIAPLIMDADTAALESLQDIRVKYLADSPGFKLEFVFGPNDFFTNEVLTKEYILENPVSSEYDDLVYDHAVGTEISWKPGKNLCFKTVTKVQRHRSNNSTRTISRKESIPSFFHFFYPPEVPEEEELDDNVDPDELDERVQMDYEIGDLIKSRIVPHAIDWFTGKALTYAEFDEDDEYYGEEDDFDYDEDEDEDEE